MPCFRTILVGADFSGLSREVYRLARSLADDHGGRLVVVHATGVPPAALGTPRWGARDGFCSIGEFFLQESPGAAEAPPDCRTMEDRLRAAYPACPTGPVDYRLGFGAAADEILRAADDVGADLIAVGAYGRGGFQGLLMGSTAEAILRRARCPALVLRRADDVAGMTQVEGETTMRPIRTILHPTDFSSRSEAALDLATSLARDRGARLIVLHVEPRELFAGGPSPAPSDSRDCRARLGEIRARLDRAGLETPAETLFLHGDPALEILLAAEEAGADLIVMGTHGRTGLRRLLMGSVAEAVLRRARCPVMTVRAPVRPAVPATGSTAAAMP